jgi:outer membrane receptor protein involved in Fe transport
MNKKITVFLAILITASFSVFAQQGRPAGATGAAGQGMVPSDFTGTVRGKIIDKSNNEPVEYANIGFYRMRDSVLVTGGITNEKGEFNIDKVPMGRYYAEIKFIGYNTLKVDNFALHPRQIEVQLGDLMLAPASENLEAITVTGQRQMLQHNLDKKVFNVERDINAEGGTALEIMQNIPSVEVDMEGNVSLRGSQNVTILVDGRPSTYSSIEEIPASIIESVEVITNPSARYDPDGLSGIINIVLKKRREPGYHGMVMFTAGTGDKYNGTLNFNYRQNKVNLFTNVSFRQFRMTGQTISDRYTNIDQPNESILLQDQDFLRNGQFISFRGGIDYFLNNSNTLTLSGGYNTRNFNVSDLTFTDITLFETNDSYFRRNSGINDGGSYNFALNYRLVGKKQGQELTSDIFYNSNTGSNNNNSFFNGIEAPTSSDIYERSTSESLGDNLTFQSDLVNPIGNGGRLESGIKASFRKQDSDYILSKYILNSWEYDALRSNNFVYSEQQYSAYAIYSNTLWSEKLSYQGGLRVEKAFTTADQKATADEPIDREFLNWFPSAHIKWDINKKNSTQIAYSRRVSRPNMHFLNPFINYTDPLNLSAGNPMLNPEFTNSLELSYYYNLPKTRVSGTIYNRQTTDIISRFVDVDEDGVAMSTFRNIDKSESLGIEAVLSQTFTQWWKMNGSASYNTIKLESDYLDAKSSKGDSWSARATSTWNLGKNIELQLNGNYRSPSVSVGGGMRFWQSGGGQGRTEEMYWFDLGMRMNVMNRKGTFTLRVSDIFNTMNFKSETWGPNFTSNIERTRESRVVWVGFSYRINEYRMRRERRSSGEDMDMDME